MQVNFNITSVLEKSFGAAASTYKREVTNWLASEYGFDASEALSKMGGMEVVKVQAKKTKKPKEETEKEEKPACLLPYHPRSEIYCQALRLDHSLYTQCSNKHLDSGEYCKTCQKTFDATGSTPYGVVSDRGERGDYVDPKGKKEKSYGTVLKQQKIPEVLARSEVQKHGIEVSDSEWEVKIGQRGRPKGVGVSDTESSAGSKESKKRGRPKKVVNAEDGEDLIAALTRQVLSDSSDEGVIVNMDALKIDVSDNSDEEEAKPVNTETEEELLKIKDKTNKKDARRLKKAAKELAAKDALAAKELAAKEALVAKELAAKDALAAKELAAKEELEAKEALVAKELAANDELKEEEEVVQRPKQMKKEVAGVNYVITNDNQVYYGKGTANPGSHCGEWNESNEEIAFAKDDESSSDEDSGSTDSDSSSE